MRRALLFAVLLPGAAHAQTPAPGVYANEEEVYLAREAGRAAAPWTSIRVTASGIEAIDAFGKPADDTSLRVVRVEGDRVMLTGAGGWTSELRRARPATCWVATAKERKQPDGSEDWHFARGLALHDQGGRVASSGGDSGARPVVLRMRNVIWPSGPNRPSLVLYVHTPDAPDRAEAYGWADPGAKTIGINLRWMQASCTIDTQGETTP